MLSSVVDLTMTPRHFTDVGFCYQGIRPAPGKSIEIRNIIIFRLYILGFYTSQVAEVLGATATWQRLECTG